MKEMANLLVGPKHNGDFCRQYCDERLKDISTD